MNQLVACSHFDITQDDDELVDYYVSFLKSLTLKLTEETVNFFFNDRFKTFPLYTQAVKFYNHKEVMVRTSVRTITLKVYQLFAGKGDNARMRDLFIGLPYCSYFAHVACQLRDTWLQVEQHVESLTME